MSFKEVGGRYDGPALEQRVLAFWRDHEVFEKSMQQSEGRPLYTWNEGPPTANGKPGIHHVLARTFKDMFPRFKHMQGYHCPRKAGWDTHGLPVEMAVEKELGFDSKDQIEGYGIAKFNQRCFENVHKYLKEWETLTERIGYWVDMDHPYITLENNYIESCE